MWEWRAVQKVQQRCWPMSGEEQGRKRAQAGVPRERTHALTPLGQSWSLGRLSGIVGGCQGRGRLPPIRMSSSTTTAAAGLHGKTPRASSLYPLNWPNKIPCCLQSHAPPGATRCAHAGFCSAGCRLLLLTGGDTARHETASWHEPLRPGRALERPAAQNRGSAPALGVSIPAALHEGGQPRRAALRDGQAVAFLGGEVDDLRGVCVVRCHVTRWWQWW